MRNSCHSTSATWTDDVDKEVKTGNKFSAEKPFCFRTTDSLVVTPSVIAAVQMISLVVMSNVFLIIYSPHQHLTSQGEPVFSEWTKEEGPDREL